MSAACGTLRGEGFGVEGGILEFQILRNMSERRPQVLRRDQRELTVATRQQCRLISLILLNSINTRRNSSNF